MKFEADEYVTLVEVLELTRPYEEFEAAARAAAHRLETEGIQALVTLQFYARPGSKEVGAILTFSDRNRMMQHINMITAWDEFRQFFRTIRPIDVRIYGRLTPDVEAWIGQFNVVRKMFDHHVTGFVRNGRMASSEL